jgi:hypothetical protein
MQYAWYSTNETPFQLSTAEVKHKIQSTSKCTNKSDDQAISDRASNWWTISSRGAKTVMTWNLAAKEKTSTWGLFLCGNVQ